MTRVAAFDCGTNSLRLLVADVDAGAGELVERCREMRIVRLGEGVDRSGRISDAAMSRVLVAVDELAELAREHRAERIGFCATSAARDAANADEFTAEVRRRVGVRPQVLTGAEEARLSFAGAVRSAAAALPGTGAAGDPRRYLVVDIGGGSTELILGRDRVEQADSLDIGSVRLTERHLSSDPPTEAEIAAVVADVDAALDASPVDPATADAVIGVAGTVTTVAAGVLGLTDYDRTLIHHAVVQVEAIGAAVGSLLAMTTEQRRALGYMHPGRADVIGAGGLVLTRVLARTPVASVLVSEQDILDGIAWDLAAEP